MGTENTATGYQALAFNTTATGNTANGYQALSSNTTGEFATAIGSLALLHNITGDGNTAIGRATLFSNTSGSNNVALGNGAGQTLTTGDDNIDIDNIGVAGESSTIRIGTFQTAAYLAGIAGRPWARVELPVTWTITVSWACFSLHADSRRTSLIWAMPVRRCWPFVP